MVDSMLGWGLNSDIELQRELAAMPYIKNPLMGRAGKRSQTFPISQSGNSDCQIGQLGIAKPALRISQSVSRLELHNSLAKSAFTGRTRYLRN